ncbi:MAG TPA: hypothetical protein VN428_23130 [Bryobacteraceae bacterium]|nr:hypothetical protein [Bryobacteraceae bacterium]
MHHFGALVLTLAALVQGPPAPAQAADAPPAVEQALRARITQFFQAHVDGKPRLAMPLVAEDSQDYFFAAEKPKYPGFEIASIQFFDDFTRAVAVVNCEQEITVQMFGKQRVKMPRKTNWRIENGQWVWFATKEEREGGAEGITLGTPGKASSNLPGPSGAEVRLDIMKGVSQLKTDKNEIRLQAARESSDSVTVLNPMSGWVTIEVVLPPEVPGLTAKIEKKDVPPKGTGRVEFEYKPTGPLTALEHRAVIRLLPMGRLFPVKVVFQKEAEQPVAPAKPAAAPPTVKKKPAAKKGR